MNLPRIFRRTRPAPKPSLDPHEVAICRWFGFTDEQWAALPNPTRTQYRDTYMKVTMP